MNNIENTIMIYTTLDNACINNTNIQNRLKVSQFTRSINKPNLFFRSIDINQIYNEIIHVSFYYYVKNNKGKSKLIRSRNLAFDALVAGIMRKDELFQQQRCFNNANGYTMDYFNYIDSLKGVSKELLNKNQYNN